MADKLAPFAAFDGSDEKGRVDLHEALSFVWRQWKFVGAITVVVLIIGTVFLLRETRLYTATSQVLIDRQREKSPAGEAILSDVGFDAAIIDAQMAIIRSTVFLRRVVENQHLTEDPILLGPMSTPSLLDVGAGVSKLLSSLRSMVGPPQSTAFKPEPDAGGTPAGAVPPDEMRAIEALKRQLSVGRVAQQGYVLAISVTSPDRTEASRLANAIADAYLVDKLDTRYEAAKRASTWLSDRLVGLRQQLREAEEAVTQFRAAHGLVQSGNLSLNQQQLSELNAKLVDARAEAAQKRARVDLLNGLQAKGSSLQNMPDLANSSALPGLRQQLGMLTAQEADLLARYGPSHPLVVNVRAQIRDVERSIGAELQRLAAGIRNEYDLAQARVSSLEKSVRDATGQSNVDDATAIRLRELERTAAVNKTLFEDFLQRAKVTQEQSTFEPQDVRVITPAQPPGEPSYPRTTQYLAINLLIGFLLGVAGAVAKEMLNTGFTTPKQLEDALGLPMLASVSHMSVRDLQVDNKNVPIYEYPTARPLSRYSEALRSLRSGIQMTDVDHPPKVIQFTSAVTGEGKTTMALSFAASGAAANLRVLFIDADLRHPSGSKALRLNDKTGLVDLLLRTVPEQEAIRFNDKGGFWVLPAGSKTQNPTDLLGSERMKSLIAECKAFYDLVVIDTPPAGPVVDPVVVSHITDKIVMVVRWNATDREAIKQCVQQLSGHPKIAGAVFNQVKDHQARKYGKYAYAYYYGARYYKNYYSQ